MARFRGRLPVPSNVDVSRRGFLQAGSLAAAGMGIGPSGGASALAEWSGSASADRDVNCILLLLVGGPSQLDTWDMKPGAPEEVRGPFRPIATNVPGTAVSEIFPKLATRMDRVSLVRTVSHDAPAIHDAGHQLMQTGRYFGAGAAHPSLGSALAFLKGPRAGAPPYVVLPRPIGVTGGNLPHGHGAGTLGAALDPLVLNTDPNAPGFGRADVSTDTSPPFDSFEWSSAARAAFDLEHEPARLRDRYGRTTFGQSCLLARRLVERGVRFVTVNMYSTVFNATSWDTHGPWPFCPIDGLRHEVGPTFDNAYTALLDDLERRGLLGSTMVLALGEHGRTPRINAAGGRDHHPGCWTVLFAGGKIQGGRVVGTSDEHAHSPSERPVSAAEIAATVYQGLGVDRNTEVPGPNGRPARLIERGPRPIDELF